MGSRAPIAHHPTQTKPHLQAGNKKRQRTRSLKWTLTNCYSCQPLSFTSLLLLDLIPLFLKDRYWWSSSLSTEDTDSSIANTIRQSASSTWPFSFYKMNKKYYIIILILILNGILWHKSCEHGMVMLFCVALIAVMLQIVLFSNSWAHLRMSDEKNCTRRGSAEGGTSQAYRTSTSQDLRIHQIFIWIRFRFSGTCKWTWNCFKLYMTNSAFFSTANTLNYWVMVM